MVVPQYSSIPDYGSLIASSACEVPNVACPERDRAERYVLCPSTVRNAHAVSLTVIF